MRKLAAICCLCLSVLLLSAAAPVITVESGAPEPLPTLLPIPTRAPKAAGELVAMPAPAASEPQRDGEFLLSGESVLWDEPNGIYEYRSPVVAVRIVRRHRTEPKLVWYEAEVWTKDGYAPRTYGVKDGVRDQENTAYLDRLATQRQLVLGLSTDFGHLRRFWGKNGGVMIREGIIMNDVTYAAGRVKYPNNDNLAIFQDGDMDVFPNAQLSAEQLLAMGAVDVFSFGPILVSDGEINAAVIAKLTKERAQRIAVGVFERNHYLFVMSEGRSSQSRGADLSDMAEIFKQRGIRDAINLDGGQSSVITFMGKYIFSTSSKQQPRRGGELLGVGVSALVGR